MLELRFTIYDGALRSLCIDHNWCTGMTIEEYGELLDNSGDLTQETLNARISHLADEIIRTSDNREGATKAEVMTEIFNRCVKAWYEDMEADDND